MTPTEQKFADEADPRAGLGTLFDLHPDGILIVSAAGRVLMGNAAALSLLGYRAHDLAGVGLGSLLTGRGPSDGRGLSPDPQSYGGESRLIRHDGTNFPAEVVTRSFQNAGGTGGIFLFFRDISERRARDRRYADHLEMEQRARLEAESARRRVAYLAGATAKLASSLDVEDSIRQLAELSVEGFARFCLVLRLVDGVGVTIAAHAHRDALGSALLRRFDGLAPAPACEGGIDPLLLSDRSLRIGGGEPLLRNLLSMNGRFPEVFTGLEASSGMVVPLRAKEKVFGALCFFNSPEDGRDFSEEDLRVAEALAQTVAFAIENARLYRDAREATEARQEMLSLVAHDLRSPLGAIAVSTEMLRDFDLSERNRGYHLEIVQRACTQMSRLIQDLVDAARVENGTLMVQVLPCPVRGLLREACQQFETPAEAQRVSLFWEADADVELVLADRLRILQVLCNLLENALRFVGPGGSVRINAVRLGNEVAISVHDTGCGIPAEELAHVFDRFWQAPGTRAVGAGLGLAICKGIVEAHGGTIEARSLPGRGTTFQFTLRVPGED